MCRPDLSASAFSFSIAARAAEFKPSAGMADLPSLAGKHYHDRSDDPEAQRGAVEGGGCPPWQISAAKPAAPNVVKRVLTCGPAS
jgi:hypothetical protein